MVIVFGAVELLTRNIPSSVSISGQQLEEEKAIIETLILGASQNKRAINPAHLSSKTLTVAGTRQGHKTDYYLLKDLHKQLPNLKQVVIGATYRHFESKPNPKDFWKYRAHLLYYNVNAFERPSYFKDKLLYLSNTRFYTNQLESYYFNNKKPSYNRFGYQLTEQLDRFGTLKYNEQSIHNSYNPKMNTFLDKQYLSFTTKWFHKVLRYCQENNLEVILTKTPTYELYREHQDGEVLHRRDSIVKVVLAKYPNIKLFDQEENTDYQVHHYLNENHLNPNGAQVFTKKLDAFLNAQ